MGRGHVHAALSAPLVKHEFYSHIELTPRGRKRAQLVYSRHRTLYQLFAYTPRLPTEISEASACGAEHHLDVGAMKRLAKLLNFLQEKARKNNAFAAELTEALDDD